MKIRRPFTSCGLGTGFAVPAFAQQTNVPNPQLRRVVDSQGVNSINARKEERHVTAEC